jgi:hypothetical protein
VRGAVGVTVDAAARLTVVVWDCDPAAPVDLSVHQVQPGAVKTDQPVADLHAARSSGNLLEVPLAEPPPAGVVSVVLLGSTPWTRS